MTTRRRQIILAASLVAATLVTLPGIRGSLPVEAAEAVATLRTAELNQQDATMLQRGYYEQLIGVSRLNSQLWEVYMNRPLELELIDQTPAGRKTGDYLNVELVPSVSIPLNGAIFTTNRWGMRDKEYERAKPAGTFRIAVAGASSTMGWAVADDQTFENLIETRLNRDRGGRGAHQRYELLNFARLGTVPPQYLGLVEFALSFQPDAYLLTAQDNEVERTLGRLAYYRLNNVAYPDDSMSAVVRRLTEGTTTEAEAVRRLDPHGEMILTYYYSRIVDRCRELGVQPLWFFLPGLEGRTNPAEKEILFRSARAAGFTTMDLSDVYAGHDLNDLRVAKGDYHPNPAAHRLIAKALYRQLEQRPDIFQRAAPESR